MNETMNKVEHVARVLWERCYGDDIKYMPWDSYEDKESWREDARAAIEAHEAWLEDQGMVRCFMDGIDWQEHLEADVHGTRLYPSIKSLRAANGHDPADDGCGVVEVEVRLVRWTHPQDLTAALEGK